MVPCAGAIDTQQDTAIDIKALYLIKAGNFRVVFFTDVVQM
jgi:hypothetical protein